MLGLLKKLQPLPGGHTGCKHVCFPMFRTWRSETFQVFGSELHAARRCGLVDVFVGMIRGVVTWDKERDGRSEAGDLTVSQRGEVRRKVLSLACFLSGTL